MSERDAPRKILPASGSQEIDGATTADTCLTDSRRIESAKIAPCLGTIAADGSDLLLGLH
jgi:hypothetical protein